MGSAAWQVLVVLLFVAVVVEGIVLLGVLRQLGGLLLRLSPARPGELENGPAVGDKLSIPGLQLERPTIVLFLAPSCNLCEQLIPTLPVMYRTYPDIDLIPIPWDDEQEAREGYARMIGERARPDLYELYREWDVRGTPVAVGLGTDGVVRSAGVVNNLDHFEAMAEKLRSPDDGSHQHDLVPENAHEGMQLSVSGNGSSDS